MTHHFIANFLGLIGEMEFSDIENNERLAQLQTLFILFENETLDYY